MVLKFYEVILDYDRVVGFSFCYERNSKVASFISLVIVLWTYLIGKKS